MATTIKSRIQIRRDTAANWTAAGAGVLLAGEIGYDTTNNIIKIGDGTHSWAELDALNVYDEGVKVGDSDLQTLLNSVTLYKDASTTATLNEDAAAGTDAEFKKIATKKYVDDAVSNAVAGSVTSDNVAYGDTNVSAALDAVALSVSTLDSEKQDNLTFVLSAAGDEYSATNGVTTKNYVDNAINGVLTQLASDVVKQMKFVGVVSGDNFATGVAALYGEGKDFAEAAAGHIVLWGTKEYVYDGSEWKLFGDESAYATVADRAALSGAIDYVSGAVDTEASAREDADDFLSGAIDGVSGAVDAVSGAVDYVSGQVDTLVAGIDGDLEYLSGQIDYAKSDIDVLEGCVISAITVGGVAGTVTNNAVSFSFDTDVSANASSVNAPTTAAVKTYVDTKVGEVAGDLSTLDGEAIKSITLNGQAFTVANNAATLSINIDGGNAAGTGLPA
jgi:hypothetical protein